MAFVKAAASIFAAPPPAAATDMRANLASPDATTRRQAARDLAGDATAAAALAARLDIEPEPSVREALFGSLVDIGGAEAAGLVGGSLRSRDAGLRNHALEALKQMGEPAFPVVDALLCDADPDVRLLAIEVTRAWSSAQAAPRLRRIIEADPHINVCGAAVDVATELGTEDLLAPLQALRARFADEAFLLFAVDVACGRLRPADAQAAVGQNTSVPTCYGRAGPAGADNSAEPA
jgi:HEAT repeat protein